MPPTRSSARQTAKRAQSNAVNRLDLNLLESSQRVTRAKAGRIVTDNSMKTTFFDNSPSPGPSSGSSSLVDVWSNNRYVETVDISVASLDSRNPTSSSTARTRLRSAPSSTISSPLSSVPSSTSSSPLSSAPSSPSTSRPSSTTSSFHLSSTPRSASSSRSRSTNSTLSSANRSTCSSSTIPRPSQNTYFTPCIARVCPIKKLHNVGLYLHKGQPPPSTNANSVFGLSNPPPEIWAALDRFRNGPATAEDLMLMASFVECHLEDDAPFEPEAYWHIDYSAINGWNQLM